MKVYELASDIGVESSQVLAVCEVLGYEITSHMQRVDDEQAEAITELIANPPETEDDSVVDDALAEEVEAEAGDMTGITDAMRGTPPPIPKPEPAKLKAKDIKILAENICEMADVGFDALYDNLDTLIAMYPERDQFALALNAKNSGNDDLGRQALRNGLVDLE